MILPTFGVQVLQVVMWLKGAAWISESHGCLRRTGTVDPL